MRERECVLPASIDGGAEMRSREEEEEEEEIRLQKLPWHGIIGTASARLLPASSTLKRLHLVNKPALMS